VHQLAGPGPLVASAVTSEDRINCPVIGSTAANRGRPRRAQHPGDHAGWHAQLRAEPGRTAALTIREFDDAVLGFRRGASRAGVRSTSPASPPVLKRVIEVRTHLRETPIAVVMCACRHATRYRSTISFRP
jgi:hypothetical protein